ncbi:MAG: energy transducer TonB [Acidobacteriia bacterium]|nr:energy transducer TonB [Terriglobia bacterium]
MRKITVICAAGILACTWLLVAPSAPAQVNSPRKIITRIAPHYPELAKRMHAEGTVKVELMVRADGTVRSTRILGGSPILVQPVVEAVQQWKFAVSQNETAEIVQLTFASQ